MAAVQWTQLHRKVDYEHLQEPSHSAGISSAGILALWRQ